MRINQGLRAAATGGVTTDPNFRNTVLLLNGDGTNGAQNNTFIDSSTNNFTITRNGNVTQGSFSPYGDRWSAYFDGTGDFLSIPDNAAFDVGSGNFTIEAWVWYEQAAAVGWIFGQTNSTFTASNTSIVLSVSTSGIPEGNVAVGSSFIPATSSTALTLNAWSHVAFVRDSSTLRIFVNGVQTGTGNVSTNTVNNSPSQAAIGRAGEYNVLPQFFKGYISNLRFLKGTALYTSNFTPPTSPLAAITNTSLLACHANRFVDGSSNNFAITRNGDTRVERFSPFAPSAEYSTSVIGGSAYFDGTGDFLTAPDNAALNFQSSDFTVECFVYFNSTATVDIFSKRTSTANYPQLVVYTVMSGGSRFLGYSGSFNSSSWGLNGTFAVGSVSFANNTWNHIAVVRSGTTFTSYINGVADLTFTGLSGALMTNTSPVVIGAGTTAGDAPLNGYISNLRILKGTALYTSNFTPPTAPLSAVTNTSLLVNAVNGGIVDATAGNVLETVGNAQVSTVQKKYGTGALYFDGTGDWLAVPDSNHWAFTGDFTIESWVYPTSLGTERIIISQWFGGTTANTAFTIDFQSTNKVRAIFSSGGTMSTINSSSTFTANNWYHIAAVRSGSIITLYVNGISEGTVTQAGAINNIAQSLFIGALNNQGTIASPFVGYIDDLRITKGVARYTANFTPPTAALPLL